LEDKDVIIEEVSEGIEEEVIEEVSEGIEEEVTEVVDDITNTITNEEVTKTVEDIETVVKKEENEVITEIKEHDDTEDLVNEFRVFLEKSVGIVEEKKNKLTISTGIDIVDAILGGGFVVGGLSIIVGQPGSGKSMLAIQTLAQAQKLYKEKLLCGYLDSEEATTTVRLANLGVNSPRIKPYTDVTVEKIFKFIEGMCVFKREKELVDTPSVIVWDSIANTLSEKEREAEDPNSVIGYKARLLSILIPKYIAKCAAHNVCFLAVNQLRDVIAMGPYTPAKDLRLLSATKDMPGGNILKFNAFQLVEMKIKSIIANENAAKYGFEGIIVKLKCVKNKLFPPNVEVEVVGSFSSGFSNFWTNYNFLASYKRLQTGAWNYLISLPEKKFRTKDAPHLYETDTIFREKFDQATKEAIQTEIIEKYNPELD